MSPLTTCETSWPSTASISSRLMPCSKPVDTATSALSRKAPVANALGAPSYTATSGSPMPARSASLRTVVSSQASSASRGWVITCAPVDHFAIVLDISSEMMEPVKPTISEKIISMPTSSPLAVRKRSMPNSRNVTDSTSNTARLVARNRKTRFIGILLAQGGRALVTDVPSMSHPLFTQARVRTVFARVLRIAAHTGEVRRRDRQKGLVRSNFAPRY